MCVLAVLQVAHTGLSKETVVRVQLVASLAELMPSLGEEGLLVIKQPLFLVART